MPRTLAVLLVTTFASMSLAAQEPDFGAAGDDAVALLQGLMEVAGR